MSMLQRTDSLAHPHCKVIRQQDIAIDTIELHLLLYRNTTVYLLSIPQHRALTVGGGSLLPARPPGALVVDILAASEGSLPPLVDHHYYQSCAD